MKTMAWQFWASRTALVSPGTPRSIGMAVMTLKESARGTAPRRPHQATNSDSLKLKGDSCWKTRTLKGRATSMRTAAVARPAGRAGSS